MAERSTRLTPGSRIGPYEVVSQLGQGGMATVYKAYQASLDRQVAIKVMADRYAADPAFVERFRREARSIARLHHPNILTVHDAGDDDGLLYMVMEYIEGETLREEMVGQPLSFERCARIIEQVSAALHYANQKGIVHRDVKPSNVLLDKNNDRAVLADFGIAKLLDGSGANLTATNEGMGTPEYMSPEQALGETLDARSDEYSLAAMTFEMLTGQPPFRGDTPIAIVMGHVSKELPSLRSFNGQILPAVEAVIRRALAKKPADRYESVAGFNLALQEALKGGSTLEVTLPVDLPRQNSQPYSSNGWAQPAPYNSAASGQPYAPTPPQPQAYAGTPPQPQAYAGTPPQPQAYAGTPPQPQAYSVPSVGGTQLPSYRPSQPPQGYGQYPNPNSGYPGGYNPGTSPQTVVKKGASVGLLAGIGAIVAVALVAIVLIAAVGGKKDTTPTAVIAAVTPTVVTNPTTTQTAPGPTAVPATNPATSSPTTGNLTKGGLPIEGNLKEIKADADTQQLLMNSLGQAGQGANLSLFSSSKPLDQLVNYYKTGPGGWTFLTDQTQAAGRSIVLAKDGKAGLFVGAPITKAFINSSGTPVSIRPSLKEGENFVMLVDNIDMGSLGSSTTRATTQINPTTQVVANPATPAANSNLKFKSYSGISGVWQAEVPDGWQFSGSTSKYSLADRFTQPDNVIEFDVSFVKDDYNTSIDRFDKSVETETSYEGYSEVKREKKQIGDYVAWLVSGNHKSSKGTFPFQYLYLNRKDGILEAKQEVRSDLGAPFQVVLPHFLETLKVSQAQPKFPLAQLDQAGKANFIPYSSPYTKWNAQIPDSWSYFSYIDKNSATESWDLDSNVSLEIRLSTGYDPSEGKADQLKKTAQDDATVRKMTDLKVEDKQISGLSAVLVTGKKPDYENKSYSYGFLLISTGKGSYYELTFTVSKSFGEAYFPSLVDKVVNSFQVNS